MEPELIVLAWGCILALVHIFVAVRFKTRQYGTKWNVGARDEDLPPPQPIVGRLARAQANFFETFPVFAAAALIVAVAGLGDRFLINIDHHAGNRMYGAINWFDESAAACGEMVFDIIKALGVPLSEEIATHIYLAILTDTGSFHHSNITPRTWWSTARCTCSATTISRTRRPRTWRRAKRGRWRGWASTTLMRSPPDGLATR